MMRVGICGGIGSGKSTVCRLLAERGVAVYCSDERARALTEQSPDILAAITDAFGADCCRDGVLDRAALAGRVFGDDAALARLNAIVHPAVRRDFEAWAEQQRGDYAVLESAILFESGFDSAVDRTVAVMAPPGVRLERAMMRDGASRERILARMASQMSDDELLARVDFSIVNLDRDDLLHDVAELDRRLRLLASQMKNDNPK